MAFLKRTWLARLGTGLNKFLIGDKGADGKQTLTNSPDTVVQEGDVISADNLNDLEDRIDNGFDDAHTEMVNGLATKQNTLTFDNVPTSGSNNPVKSGGIYSAIKEVADDVNGMKLIKVWTNPNPAHSFDSEDIVFNSVINEVMIQFRPYYYKDVSIYGHFRSNTDDVTGSGTMLAMTYMFYGILQGESSSNTTFIYRPINFKVTSTNTTIQIYGCRRFGSTSGNLGNHLVPVAIYKVGDIYTT